VEYRHIIDEFQRVALAHPQIHFTFTTMAVNVQFASFNFTPTYCYYFTGKTNEN
jgi:DNA mismatch repair protein MutL